MIYQHSRSTLFPYTTLFRSHFRSDHEAGNVLQEDQRDLERIAEIDEASGFVGGIDIEHSANKAARFVNLCDAFEIPDRKSTRLNSSHVSRSYAVFCLNKKKF